MLLISNAVFTEYVAHLTKREISDDRFAEYREGQGNVLEKFIYTSRKVRWISERNKCETGIGIEGKSIDGTANMKLECSVMLPC